MSHVHTPGPTLRLDTVGAAPTAPVSGSLPPAAEPSSYQAPGWFTRKVFNPAVRALTALGVSVWGSRVLEVPGRRTGELRRTPVNLLELDGQRYLVAPRGETQWVRNVRAAGGRLALRVGRRCEVYVAEELTDDAKAPVLRAYLRRWKAESGAFFGVNPAASHDELRTIAPAHPVFLLAAAP